ncbi:MAG: hypothetical protein ABF291_07810 [Desulfobacterales bacterium]
MTLARQLDARVHLMHVLRRLDWFVNNFLSELSGSNFKLIAEDFENQVQNQAKQKLEEFKKQYLSDIHNPIKLL